MRGDHQGHDHQRQERPGKHQQRAHRLWVAREEENPLRRHEHREDVDRVNRAPGPESTDTAKVEQKNRFADMLKRLQKP